MIKRVFWSEEEHRVRALWRFALHMVILIALIIPQFVILSTIYILAQGLKAEETLLPGVPDALTGIAIDGLFGLALLSAVLLSVWLAGFFVDRRRFADFGLRRDLNWWIDLGFGLALGVLLMGLVFLVEWAAGWVTVTGTLQAGRPEVPFAVGILFGLLAFIGVGIYEELVFRGYYLKNLAEGLGFMRRPKWAILVAVLLTSVVFGLAHAPNPNATAISTLYLCFAGIQLALGYLLTGELAIPIGLHITWNFFQGNVFGFPVSGGNAGATFIAIRQGGDPLLTGGAFGPEAGLVGLGAMALGCALIALWVRLRYGRATICERLAVPDLLPRRQGPDANPLA